MRNKFGLVCLSLSSVFVACSSQQSALQSSAPASSGDSIKVLLACETKAGWTLQAQTTGNHVVLNYSKKTPSGERTEHSIAFERNQDGDMNANDNYLEFGVLNPAQPAGGPGPTVRVSDNDLDREVQLFEAINSLPFEKITMSGRLNQDLKVVEAGITIKHRQRELENFTAAALTCDGAPKAFNGLKVAETNQPEINLDRSAVTIKAGAAAPLTIQAKDLQALVTNVPNVDSAGSSTKLLSGSYIFRVAQNPRTKVVAIAVRSFIYAETDFSMLFLVDPASAGKPQLVSFVMPGKAALPANTTHAFRWIRDLSYDASGILHVVQSDASESTAEVLVNPNGSIRSCSYSHLEGSEGALCGEYH